MNPIAAKQVALGNALIAPENRVNIGICNMRTNPTKTSKEPTYQVVLDALALTTYYPAFLITTEICPRLPNQEFVLPPSYAEDIVSFIKELRCLSRKTTCLDKIRLSRAQILWGMYYNKNVDFVDSILGSLRFVSKTKEYQVCGALIPAGMTNRKMLNSTAYKTYLAFSTGAATPKKARKFKKPASLSMKKTLVAVEELAMKPAKKPAARRQSAGVQIRDTPSVSVSKKKAPAKSERSKGIELLSKVAILIEAQMKRAIKRSKRETDIHQAGSSSEGASLELEVPDEQKGKSSDTTEGTGDSDDDDGSQQSNDEQNDSDNPRTSDDEEETQEDDNYGVLGRYGVSVPALTKDHEGNKIQYAVSRRRQYAVFKLYGNKIFLKISNVVPTLRNPRYAVSKTLDMPKHFKTLSLNELRSPDFHLFSDQEEYSEEEVLETMAKTMEQYMSKTQADYGSGVARPKIEDKDSFELKGQFLKKLHDNTFNDQVMLRSFPMSLTGVASRLLRNKPSGSITTLKDLKTKFLSKYCPPARTAKKIEEINNFQQEPDENL
ncbi:retrovirus-related pol polyprotein from transposon TNT 1-94 [Tanacetum coccineum]